MGQKLYGNCKPVPGVSCGAYTNGKKCEDLSNDQCSHMQNDRGCCQLINDINGEDGNGTVRDLTADDVFKCGNETRNINSMNKLEKSLCRCTNNKIDCSYDDPPKDICNYFQQPGYPLKSPNPKKPWQQVYTCKANSSKIISVAVITMLSLVFGGLIYKGKIESIAALTIVVGMLYFFWFTYKNFLRPECPNGSKNSGFRSCIQHTKGVYKKNGKCPEGYVYKGLLGGYKCVAPCQAGFKRRSYAVGSAFCDSKLQTVYNPFE